MSLVELKIPTDFFCQKYENETVTPPNFTSYELFCLKSKLNNSLKHLLTNAYILYFRSDSYTEEQMLTLQIFDASTDSVKRGTLKDLEDMLTAYTTCKSTRPGYALLSSADSLSKRLKIPLWWIKEILQWLDDHKFKDASDFGDVPEIRNILEYRNSHVPDYIVDMVNKNTIALYDRKTFELFVSMDEDQYIDQSVGISENLFNFLRKAYENGYIPAEHFPQNELNSIVTEFQLVNDFGMLKPKWRNSVITDDMVQFLSSFPLREVRLTRRFLKEDIERNILENSLQIEIVKYNDDEIILSFAQFNDLLTLTKYLLMK